jgi:hypothetical protein
MQKPRFIISRWITVLSARHPKFGGGMIEVDLPDTPYHRAMYPEDRIVRVWTQLLEV